MLGSATRKPLPRIPTVPGGNNLRQSRQPPIHVFTFEPRSLRTWWQFAAAVWGLPGELVSQHIGVLSQMGPAYGCARSAFDPICSVCEVRPSPKSRLRQARQQADMIVLHYTGMADTQAALAKLCAAGREVLHPLRGHGDGYIVQCVPEAAPAWHAGAPRGKASPTSTRARSGSRSPIRATVRLSGISQAADRRRHDALPQHLQRHRIPAGACSVIRDVATRKQDPGEKFSLAVLRGDAGIGLWVKPGTQSSRAAPYVSWLGEITIGSDQPSRGTFRLPANDAPHPRPYPQEVQRTFPSRLVDGGAIRTTI